MKNSPSISLFFTSSPSLHTSFTLLFVGNQQETTVCEDVKDIFNSFAREKILNKTASPSIHVGTEGDVVCSLFRKKTTIDDNFSLMHLFSCIHLMLYFMKEKFLHSSLTLADFKQVPFRPPPSSFLSPLA